MTNQNSLYAPKPFSVASGGTGNNGTLANGQLWVGNGTTTPAVTNISSGTGILVTNGAGTITIANTAPNNFTWNDIGSSTSVNLIPNNGYFITGSPSNPTFTIPVVSVPGDTFKIMGAGGGDVNPATVGFTVIITTSATFFYPRAGGYLGTTLSVTGNAAASITITCLKGVAAAQYFGVESTNGATFVLT